eukprot:GHVS01019034.1.p1 GENE.GHVS01019034.1~~GHVS01019034.1.p1  ORF type:complete len:266 (-),score=71.50 GHVS01019034.1:390-1187(-)
MDSLIGEDKEEEDVDGQEGLWRKHNIEQVRKEKEGRHGAVVDVGHLGDGKAREEMGEQRGGSTLRCQDASLVEVIEHLTQMVEKQSEQLQRLENRVSDLCYLCEHKLSADISTLTSSVQHLPEQQHSTVSRLSGGGGTAAGSTRRPSPLTTQQARRQSSDDENEEQQRPPPIDRVQAEDARRAREVEQLRVEQKRHEEERQLRLEQEQIKLQKEKERAEEEKRKRELLDAKRKDFMSTLMAGGNRRGVLFADEIDSNSRAGLFDD